MSATPVVGELRCEHEVDPIGIDSPSPRFSWRVTGSRRGLAQTAYRLVVVEPGDSRQVVWDSGRVESDDVSHVAYAGPPLQSCRDYRWTVTCWDERGERMGAPNDACFVTGLLPPQRLSASWISMRDPVSYESTFDLPRGVHHTEYHAMYFRTDFTCEQPPVRAYAFMSATGLYELWLNGRRVGANLLDPAPTDYRHEALVSAYDITSIVGASNAVGVILGNGRCLGLHGFAKPAVFCEIQLVGRDGTRQAVRSGQGWFVGHGPLQNNGIYFGERYDARLESPCWPTPDGPQPPAPVEDALVVDGPALRSQRVDPIRIERELHAVRVSSPVPGIFVYDFGQNLAGFVRLRVRGPAGTTVTIRHAELLNEDGTINTSTNRYACATDVYILSGRGQETYQPRFTYHGFRYVEVAGYPGVPSDDSVVALFVHSSVERVGSFCCSDELINAIHRNTVWSQLSNLMGIPTDCPQREERMGWLGDVQVISETAILNFDMLRFYRKYLEDIRVSQHADGGLSNVVPEYWRLHPADPAWGTAYVTLLWNLYWYYGDTAILTEHYEAVKRYVDYLDSVATDGVVGQFSRFLFGDWCPPGCNLPKRTPIELTSTWYYYHDTLLLSRIATVLNRTSDRDHYTGRAEEIRAAFNTRFLTDRGYETIAMGPFDLIPGQTSNVLPLALNMVPPQRREAITSLLIESIAKHDDCHLDTGILGTRYLFDVLSAAGAADLACRIIRQRSYPGWGYMIDQGATTLWERWEKKEGTGMNSHNHTMLGSVDSWFYRVLAGLTPAEPGWKTVRYQPHPVGGVRHASASVETIRGRAAIAWVDSDGSFTCTVTVPAGATGQVVLPIGPGPTEVRQDGDTVHRTNDNGDERTYTATVRSGAYSFEVRGEDDG